MCSIARQNGGGAVIICTTWWCFYDLKKKNLTLKMIASLYNFLAIAAELY